MKIILTENVKGLDKAGVLRSEERIASSFAAK